MYSQTRYVYDGWQLVQEIDILTDTVIAEYVYGPGYIDDVVQSRHDLDFPFDGMQPDETPYYHHTDQQYSTVALTNTGGEVVEYYNYDAFGNPTFYDSAGVDIGASDINNPVLYTGRTWQPKLGLYDYRNRQYDPTTGRFTTPDPLGAHGDWNNLGNAYTYVGNNPTRYLDPWGLSMELASQRSYPVFSGTLGFFVGAGQGIAVAIDTPAIIPEWLGVGERPLKYLGVYEDTDPGIGASRTAAGVGWGTGIGAGGIAVLAPNLGTASLASPSALYTAAWLDALSLGTGVSATGLTAKEALHRSSKSLAQRPGQAIRTVFAATQKGSKGIQNASTITNNLGESLQTSGERIQLAKPGEDLFVGTYSQVRAANIRSGLNATHTPHHSVQNAISPSSSRSAGITINLDKNLHGLTRTFGRSVIPAPNLRTHLARDIYDLRKILREAGYSRQRINIQLQELIRQNKAVGGFDK